MKMSQATKKPKAAWLPTCPGIKTQQMGTHVLGVLVPFFFS